MLFWYAGHFKKHWRVLRAWVIVMKLLGADYIFPWRTA